MRKEGPVRNIQAPTSELHRRSKFQHPTSREAPNSNIQRNSKIQSPNPAVESTSRFGKCKSARGQAHSKTWRNFDTLSIGAKRLGVRQPSGALGCQPEKPQ